MPNAPQNAVVWTEIPVSDLAKAITFYNAVFQSGLTLDTSGPQPIAIFQTADGYGAVGNLYQGKPARDGAGPTVHLLVPGTLEEAIDRCAKAGGTVKPGIIPLAVGRVAHASDPDGNSIGLFQPN